MLAHLEPAITDLITGFLRDPESAGSDTELRKSLYSALYRHFATAGIRYRLPHAAPGDEAGAITLTPVKTGYPRGAQFDVAVLDVVAAPEKRPAMAHDYAGYWQLPLAAAVNIHLAKPGQDPAEWFGKLDRDLRKFAAHAEADAEFCGLSLLLVPGEVGAQERLERNTWELQTGTQAWVVGEDGVYAFAGGR